MKKLQGLLLAALSFSIISCNNNGNTANETQDEASQQMSIDSAKHAELNKIAISNEKDPVCDMPTLRGFEDTAMYEGMVFGFCSHECKEEFVKNPTAYKTKSE